MPDPSHSKTVNRIEPRSDREELHRDRRVGATGIPNIDRLYPITRKSQYMKSSFGERSLLSFTHHHHSLFLVVGYTVAGSLYLFFFAGNRS